MLALVSIKDGRSDALSAINAPYEPGSTLKPFTVAGLPPPNDLLPEAVLVLGRVAVAPFATPGTDEVPASLEPLWGSSDVILLETVGVGQSELDIARAADTTVVVLVPESGDSIQAMKAGLMEIADFFVVNKADRAGAEQAVMSIKTVLGFKAHGEGWMADVLQTIAQDGKGIGEVAAMIAKHRVSLETAGELKVRRAIRLEERIQELISERLHQSFWNDERGKLLKGAMEEVLSFKTTPYDVVERLLSAS